MTALALSRILDDERRDNARRILRAMALKITEVHCTAAVELRDWGFDPNLQQALNHDHDAFGDFLCAREWGLVGPMKELVDQDIWNAERGEA